MHLICLHRGRVFNRRNVPKNGPVLLISNHQSFFDPVIVGYGLDLDGSLRNLPDILRLDPEDAER